MKKKKETDEREIVALEELRIAWDILFELTNLQDDANRIGMLMTARKIAEAKEQAGTEFVHVLEKLQRLRRES